MKQAHWRWSLPAGAGACLAAAMALEFTSPGGPFSGGDSVRTLAGVTLFVFAAFLSGAWLVLLGVHHDDEPGD